MNLGIDSRTKVSMGIAKPDTRLAIDSQIFWLIVIDAIYLVGQSRSGAVLVELNQTASGTLSAI